MVKTKVTVAILVLALALFIPFAIQAKPTPTPPGQHLNITQVFVDVPPGQITINGTDLDFGPGPLVVTLGNFGPLDNCSGDDMEIMCDLPEGILKGDYLLTVSNGNGQSQGDEYDLTVCSDLAPACFDANNWSDTDDGDGFIADCVASAECLDAQDACEGAAAEEDGCEPCIFTGTSCDGCNQYLVGRLRCTNVCQEQQCFDASDYVGDVDEFLTACEEIAECDPTCKEIVSPITECEKCIVDGDLDSCKVCNREMDGGCGNICGGIIPQ